MDNTYIKVAKPGYDVKTAEPENLVFTSEFPPPMIYQRGERKLTRADFTAYGTGKILLFSIPTEVAETLLVDAFVGDASGEMIEYGWSGLQSDPSGTWSAYWEYSYESSSGKVDFYYTMAVYNLDYPDNPPAADWWDKLEDWHFTTSIFYYIYANNME